MGRAYQPFAKKSEGLAPFRYSIIIENVREASYFSEKLIDAFLCKTLPIYWGAPDIGEYFNADGMVVCESFHDIKNAIEQASEIQYNERLAAIESNQIAAAAFENLHERAALAVKSVL